MWVVAGWSPQALPAFWVVLAQRDQCESDAQGIAAEPSQGGGPASKAAAEGDSIPAQAEIKFDGAFSLTAGIIRHT